LSAPKKIISPPGAVDAHEFRVIVDLLAAQAAAPGNSQGRHPPLRVIGRAAEHLEIHIPHKVAHTDQFQVHAQVGPVGAVALHGLGIGHARKFGQRHIENLLEQPAHHALGDIHHILFRHETGLDIDLGELRLAVGAQVLVAETTRNLVIAVKPRDHQQLLEQLGGLGQGKKLSRVRAAGHQVVAGTLRCRPGQYGGFHIEKPLAFQKAPHGRCDFRALYQVALHLGTAQVHVAVAQAHLLADRGMVIELKRRCVGAVEQFQLLTQHLDRPRAHGGIDGRLAARAHPSADAHRVLAAHPVGAFKVFSGVRVENHLHDPFPVPEVQEDDAAMVAAAVDPATQCHLLVYVGFVQHPAVVAAHKQSCRVLDGFAARSGAALVC